VKAVLVDTGPLVALLDDRDALHRRALREARQIRVPALVGVPVLTEALHFLRDPLTRSRLAVAFKRGSLQLVGQTSVAHVEAALTWLDRFADRSPDFADAYLVAWAASDSGVSIWTFDTEFRTVWRTASGRSVRLTQR
jgi:uncharacterized protein